MPANWKELENSLVRILRNREAKDENDLAKKIADEYNRAIVNNAQDLMLANRVLTVKKSSLESSLRTAFKLAKLARSNDESQRIMRSFINTGIIAYWTGGQLTLTNPPPPATTVVSNIVVFPGVPPDVKISNTSKVEDFAREFTARVRAHALTVKVVTTGVAPNGATVVVNISGIN